MADLINLKQFKKARVRDERDAKAAENRIKFGLNKAQKNEIKATNKLAEKNLDGHKRED
jgi:Domain of unknown function (DUF4169)